MTTYAEFGKLTTGTKVAEAFKEHIWGKTSELHTDSCSTPPFFLRFPSCYEMGEIAVPISVIFTAIIWQQWRILCAMLWLAVSTFLPVPSPPLMRKKIS